MRAGRFWGVRGTVALAAAMLAGTAPLGGSALGPAPGRTLSFLHVGPPSGPSNLPQVVDAHGRVVLLKGVNGDGLVDYWRPDLKLSYPVAASAYANGACPADDPSVEGVVLCAYDFAQMRPLGYNTLRLNLSWSLLEPSPGQVDGAYLERIAQVVGWARVQGMYVVLDMHQDAWSKYVYTAPGETCPPPTRAIRGYDGAPSWATAYTGPACAVNGVRELDPAVHQCFAALYRNAAAPDGIGLQDHYASLFIALARRFATDPTVAGYELINEPSPVPELGPDETTLFPFYSRVIGAVVAAVPGFQQMFFIEPNVLRDVTDQSGPYPPWSAFSTYPNTVYAPHVYTGVFTADQQVASTRFMPSDGGYRSAVQDSSQLALPLWVGEFGNDPADDDVILRNSYTLQDRDQVGGAFWLWKENANDINGALFWGVYGKPFPPGTPQPKRLKLTGRAYPLFTAGTLQSFAYDPDSGTFVLDADSNPVPRGAGDRATVVFVPARTAGDVVATGATVEVFDRGGGLREAYIYPTGGHYHVTVRAAERAANPGPRQGALPNTSR
jgi:endoglycosylceramidase